jgi:WD40 repeat protein
VVAVGSDEKEIALWDWNSQSLLAKLVGHTGAVRSLKLLNDGRLASGSMDNSTRVWNLTTFQTERVLLGHSSGVRAIDLLSNGNLASGSSDQTIRIWNTTNGNTSLLTISAINSVCSLKGLSQNRLASGYCGVGKIDIWNAVNATKLGTLNEHTRRVFSLDLTTDGLLLSGSTDTTLKLWNVTNFTCLSTYFSNQTINAMKFIPQLSAVMIGGNDSYFQLIGINSTNGQLSFLKKIANPIVNSATTWAMAVSNESDVLLTTLNLFDIGLVNLSDLTMIQKSIPAGQGVIIYAMEIIGSYFFCISL